MFDLLSLGTHGLGEYQSSEEQRLVKISLAETCPNVLCVMGSL